MPKRYFMLSIVGVIIVTAAITAYYTYQPNAGRILKFRNWMNDPASHPDWKLIPRTQRGASLHHSDREHTTRKQYM